jgi:hypothetical protein
MDQAKDLFVSLEIVYKTIMLAIVPNSDIGHHLSNIENKIKDKHVSQFAR